MTSVRSKEISEWVGSLGRAAPAPPKTASAESIARARKQLAAGPLNFDSFNIAMGGVAATSVNGELGGMGMNLSFDSETESITWKVTWNNRSGGQETEERVLTSAELMTLEAGAAKHTWPPAWGGYIEKAIAKRQQSESFSLQWSGRGTTPTGVSGTRETEVSNHLQTLAKSPGGLEGSSEVERSSVPAAFLQQLDKLDSELGEKGRIFQTTVGGAAVYYMVHAMRDNKRVHAFDTTGMSALEQAGRFDSSFESTGI